MAWTETRKRALYACEAVAIALGAVASLVPSAFTFVAPFLLPALVLAIFAWVTKRFIKGMVATPEGWPEGSPMIRSTISSYRVLWLCHRYLTPKYRALVAEARSEKRVHHLRSAAEIGAFLVAVAAATTSA